MQATWVLFANFWMDFLALMGVAAWDVGRKIWDSMEVSDEGKRCSKLAVHCQRGDCVIKVVTSLERNMEKELPIT